MNRPLLALALALLVTGLLVAEHRLEYRAALDGIEGALVRGEVESAQKALGALPQPLGPSPRRAFLEKIVATWSGETLSHLPEVPIRAPLTLAARTAFDHGDTAATVRLAELAEQLGRPIPPSLVAAALVEEGHDDKALSLLPPPSPSEGRLAQNLRQRLEHPPKGRLLRDRHGRPVAELEDGEVRSLLDTPAEGLLPQALAQLELPDAPSVRLTLDLELAHAARAAFSPRDRGSIVLLDPTTGDILAAVSDAQTLAEGGTPAFEQLREPASISKLITTTAALRSGIDPDAELAEKSCRGHALYGGERLYCPVISGRLRGLDRAMAVSCNVAFADLGARVGRQGLVDELRLFGFDRPAGDFRGGRILAPQGDERQLADLSIGLDDSELTPLNAALLAATFATGTMPTPNLLHATDGHLGLHPHLLPQLPGRRLLESEWLPTLWSAMEAVSRGGTGRGIAPQGFPVAMKTGTASHPLYGFHVNYIGFGPLPETHIAFAVRITHQRTSRHVRSAARRVTHHLLVNLERVARQRGWAKASPSERQPGVYPLPGSASESSPQQWTAR